MDRRGLPGGPVIRSLRGTGLDPGWGAKIPQATWHGLKKNVNLFRLSSLPFRTNWCIFKIYFSSLFGTANDKTPSTLFSLLYVA